MKSETYPSFRLNFIYGNDNRCLGYFTSDEKATAHAKKTGMLGGKMVVTPVTLLEIDGQTFELTPVSKK